MLTICLRTTNARVSHAGHVIWTPGISVLIAELVVTLVLRKRECVVAEFAYCNTMMVGRPLLEYSTILLGLFLMLYTLNVNAVPVV